MRQIPITPTPQQRLSVRLDDQRLVLTLKTARGCMVADLERDGVGIIRGTRVLAGEPIIPYAYLEDGNFILLTRDDALPDYSRFGSDQFLFYLTIAEVDALKASRASPGTRIPAGSGYVSPVPSILGANLTSVWGVARLSSTIEVMLADVTHAPTVDPNGEWSFATPVLPPGDWPIRARYVTPVPSPWSDPFMYSVSP